MIGVLIHSRLDAFEELDLIIQGKVFPLVVPDGTEVPHIAYGIRHFPPDYVKTGSIVGGSVVDNIEVALNVSSLKYKELQDIVGKVRLAIESETLTYGNVTTKPILLYSIEESYDKKTRNFHSMIVFKVMTNRMV